MVIKCSELKAILLRGGFCLAAEVRFLGEAVHIVFVRDLPSINNISDFW